MSVFSAHSYTSSIQDIILNSVTAVLLIVATVVVVVLTIIIFLFLITITSIEPDDEPADFTPGAIVALPIVSQYSIFCHTHSQ